MRLWRHSPGSVGAMTVNGWVVAIVAAVAMVATAAYFLFSARVDGRDAEATKGRLLYAKSCAQCHGANLEGQPDWIKRKPDGRLPAPPHDESGHTWHHSDEQLFRITKFGLQAIEPGYESDMPAFEGTLSDSQIKAIIEFIKSTWPDRARTYQADRSRQDP